MQGELDLTLFYKIEGCWGMSWVPGDILKTEILNDLNDRDLNDRKTPLNIYLFFWWNSFLVLAIASSPIVGFYQQWAFVVLHNLDSDWVVPFLFLDALNNQVWICRLWCWSLVKVLNLLHSSSSAARELCLIFPCRWGDIPVSNTRISLRSLFACIFAHVHKILQSCLTANQIYSR